MVGNYSMVTESRPLYSVSVTQVSMPVRHVTPATRIPTSVLPTPLVLPAANAFVTTASTKITGHVTHVSVSFRTQVWYIMSIHFEK